MIHVKQLTAAAIALVAIGAAYPASAGNINGSTNSVQAYGIHLNGMVNGSLNGVALHAIAVSGDVVLKSVELSSGTIVAIYR